jgi:hypothetical protein
VVLTQNSCTRRLDYDVIQPSLIPVYRDQLIPKIKVLIYNGQGDACVPWNNNEEWTVAVGLNPVKPWHAWLVDYQVRTCQFDGYLIPTKNDVYLMTK